MYSGWLRVRLNTVGSYRGNGGSLTRRNWQENDGTRDSMRGVSVQILLNEYADKSTKSREISRLLVFDDVIRSADPGGGSWICLAQ